MKKKNKRTIVLILIMVLVFILGSLTASVCFINKDVLYRGVVTKTYHPTDGSFTEEDVLSICSMDGNKYIECINDLFVSKVEPNATDCDRRGVKAYSALEVLNQGKGCCRDAIEYYSYFLDKKGIDNQLVYIPEHNPTHIFVVATIMKNESINNYRIIDFNLLW